MYYKAIHESIEAQHACVAVMCMSNSAGSGQIPRDMTYILAGERGGCLPRCSCSHFLPERLGICRRSGCYGAAPPHAVCWAGPCAAQASAYRSVPQVSSTYLSMWPDVPGQIHESRPMTCPTARRLPYRVLTGLPCQPVRRCRHGSPSLHSIRCTPYFHDTSALSKLQDADPCQQLILLAAGQLSSVQGYALLPHWRRTLFHIPQGSCR